jgi:hypothetical protein
MKEMKFQKCIFVFAFAVLASGEAGVPFTAGTHSICWTGPILKKNYMQ